MLEEELSLQLSLLKKETPPATLFPEVEDPMEQLPHLKDGTVAANLRGQERQFVMDTLIEEEVLESFAICGLIAMIMFAPNLFQ